ncbi:MAG: alkaline phosphatase, partial [Muribaculaceae bacterium]|nr:alkaline phosphatase [Muribaculaceae bacterium]
VSFDRKTQKYVDDLPEVMAANGVQTFTDTKSFPVKTDKTVVLLGNLHDYTTGYAIDHPQNTVMLPEMTQVCLDQLMLNSPDHFFMMVEGGNIDYAAHPNDGCTQLLQVINFDEALSIAYEFYKKHPDETLIVVTSDHETGGISLGCKHTRYNAYMQYVDHQKMSKDAFMAWSKEMLKSDTPYTWEQMKAMLEENFGFWTVLPVNEQQTASLKEKFEETFTRHSGTDQKTLYNTFNNFTVEVFKVINDICGFGWTSLSHTGGLVNVFAIGDDASRFQGFNDNTDIPRHILDAALPGTTLN